MKDILLCTLNSTYQHSSFGLRYLYANLEEYQSRTEILEFTIAQNPKDITAKILELQPKIVGFGIYIWNTEETLHIVSLLKAVAPHVKIVLGGPEVSHEAQSQEIVRLADYTLQGEADFLFLNFCRDFFAGKLIPKITPALLPEISKVKYPYRYYSDSDIANRVVYVEASRGCPYKCEYCLSSLDKSVRNFEITAFLAEMQILIERGVRQFKFVDRTFNLSPSISGRILEFFLKHIDLGLFLHFEMVPDRLPDELKILIENFPKGSLQFEVGIQTFNPEVAKNVSRRQDYIKIKENFKYLREKTHVHTHADLIVGLPGETLASFAAGFDTLVEYQPDEIQVGLLKRLKGFPLARHDSAFQMVYDGKSPFQILQNKDLDFMTVQRLAHFAKVWDLVFNSGNFTNLMQVLFSFLREQRLSYFMEFYELSRFVAKRHPQNHGIALLSLVETIWLYFSAHAIAGRHSLDEILALDYAYGKRRDVPHFLKEKLSDEFILRVKNSNFPQKLPRATAPQRQIRHAASSAPDFPLP